MELPKIPFYRKYSLTFKAVIVGGILGLLYAVFTDAGSGYAYLRFLPGTIIGIFISIIIITFERSVKLNKDSFF